MPRSSHISNARFTLRTACYWLSAWQQAGTTAIVIVRRFVVKSLLFVSGSVRVRVRARVSARVTLTVRDRDRI